LNSEHSATLLVKIRNYSGTNPRLFVSKRNREQFLKSTDDTYPPIKSTDEVHPFKSSDDVYPIKSTDEVYPFKVFHITLLTLNRRFSYIQIEGEQLTYRKCIIIHEHGDFKGSPFSVLNKSGQFSLSLASIIVIIMYVLAQIFLMAQIFLIQ
jgi:hypothetical protein